MNVYSFVSVHSLINLDLAWWILVHPSRAAGISVYNPPPGSSWLTIPRSNPASNSFSALFCFSSLPTFASYASQDKRARFGTYTKPIISPSKCTKVCCPVSSIWAGIADVIWTVSDWFDPIWLPLLTAALNCNKRVSVPLKPCIISYGQKEPWREFHSGWQNVDRSRISATQH